jgi:hypothetical protein
MKRLSKRGASRHPPRDVRVTSRSRRRQAQIRGSDFSIGSNSASPPHVHGQTFVALGSYSETGLSTIPLRSGAISLGYI